MRETYRVPIEGKARKGPTSAHAMACRTWRERIRRLVLGPATRDAIQILRRIARDPEQKTSDRVAASRGILDASMRLYASSAGESERRPILDMIRQASEAHARLKASATSSDVATKQDSTHAIASDGACTTEAGSTPGDGPSMERGGEDGNHPTESSDVTNLSGGASARGVDGAGSTGS